MLVLRLIFGTNTKHIPTHEVSKVLRAYLCSVKYAGVKTNVAPCTFSAEEHYVSVVLWAYLCSVGYAGFKTNIWH